MARKKAQKARDIGREFGRGRPKEADRIRADRHESYDQPKPEEAPKRAPRATDQAAKVSGTSGRSVARFKRVQNEAPDLAEKVKAGTMALDRAERIIRDRAAEQRRIEQARREAETAAVKTIVDIREGDAPPPRARAALVLLQLKQNQTEGHLGPSPRARAARGRLPADAVERLP